MDAPVNAIAGQRVRPRRSARAALRLTGLAAALLLLTLNTPLPWGWLWMVIPALTALALLVTWRFGIKPASLVLALAAGAAVGGRAPWIAWMPAAALTGLWMGAREEGGGPQPGERAWMLVPLLLVAAVLPSMPAFRASETRFAQAVHVSNAGALELYSQLGCSPEQRHQVADANAASERMLPYVLPAALFLWMALLVSAGRAVAARVAAMLGWPLLSRGRLADWRLPDAGVWVFILGLALALSPWPAAAPAAWTLLIGTGVGFCFQGMAVVESMLLARGVPPALVVLTLLFVVFVALPLFLLTTLGLGLSDVWLDYRRLEPAPEKD